MEALNMEKENEKITFHLVDNTKENKFSFYQIVKCGMTVGIIHIQDGKASVDMDNKFCEKFVLEDVRILYMFLAHIEKRVRAILEFFEKARIANENFESPFEHESFFEEDMKEAGYRRMKITDAIMRERKLLNLPL
jgi:hypothetical protein